MASHDSIQDQAPAAIVSTAQPAITEIAPARGWTLPNLGELWAYRGVIVNMVRRNFRIKYRQTVGGPLYAVYEPLMTMIGYSILLGGLAGLDADGGISYPVFTFSALTVWTLFTASVRMSSTSLFSNSGLVTKIYVPRLAFPLIAVAMALVDFAIAFVVLLLLMFVSGYGLTLSALWLPLYTLIALTLALGIGLWFSALHARFRDTNYAIGLITKGLFFLTPVVYSSTLLPPPWDVLYALNPMAVVVEGYRWALLGVGSAPTFSTLALAGLLSLGILLTGLFTFRRLEMNIADVV